MVSPETGDFAQARAEIFLKGIEIELEPERRETIEPGEAGGDERLHLGAFDGGKILDRQQRNPRALRITNQSFGE